MSHDQESEVKPLLGIRRPQRVGLIWTLLVVLLLTALVPLFLTAYKLMDISKEGLEAGSREYQLKVASTVVQDLDAAIRGARNQLSAIGHYLESQLLRTHMQDALRGDDLLAPYLQGDLVMLRYTSRAGSVLEVGSSSAVSQEALSASLFEAFATVMVGEAYVGRPLQVAGEGRSGVMSRPSVVVAVPVMVRNKTRGVLAALVDLSGAWKRSIAGFGQNYITFGLDDSGAIFASLSMPDILLRGENYRRLEIVKRYRAGAGVIETLPFEAPEGMDIRELLGARAVTKQGWGIFVLVDRDLAYASVSDMKRSVYQWAIFAVGLAVISAVVFAGAITRPLKILVDRARRMAGGDFTTRADIRSRNEVGELADTFNFMSEEIRNYISRIKLAAEENNQLFMGTIKALAAAIDEKDPYTRGHSDRVHRYSVAIARRLGLDRTELRDITVGALLHDIGKIGIEDAILRKPAALSDKEFDIMKRHPLKGANIMSEMPEMKAIIPAMRNHHEKWSGGGYPDNLKGEEIPLIARIVQVADTFDAMTTNRPYQRAMRTDAAVARINELSSIVFDPRVVAAFREAWMGGEIRPESDQAPPKPAEKEAEPSTVAATQ